MPVSTTTVYIDEWLRSSVRIPRCGDFTRGNAAMMVDGVIRAARGRHQEYISQAFDAEYSKLTKLSTPSRRAI
jgi:hypothetical protein